MFLLGDTLRASHSNEYLSSKICNLGTLPKDVLITGYYSL